MTLSRIDSGATPRSSVPAQKESRRPGLADLDCSLGPIDRARGLFQEHVVQKRCWRRQTNEVVTAGGQCRMPAEAGQEQDGSYQLKTICITRAVTVSGLLRARRFLDSGPNNVFARFFPQNPVDSCQPDQHFPAPILQKRL